MGAGPERLREPRPLDRRGLGRAGPRASRARCRWASTASRDAVHHRSHTSYRTPRVREIGGFQPTRAEDHLDTVVLASRGFRGVFVPEIIATGDGPGRFATYLGQQFAWAYSMIQIFLQHTPRLLRRTPPRRRCSSSWQSWYTLWSISVAVLWPFPVVALLVNRPIARRPLRVPRVLPRGRAGLHAHVALSRRWFQPRGIGLTWRGVVLEIARWPIVLWAVVNVLLRIGART